MTSEEYLHNVIMECLSKLNNDVLNESFNTRRHIPKVRGGWNKNKILKYLKSIPSNHGSFTAAQFIAEFDNVKELKEHIFWHGSPFPQTRLRPSITKSERWAEQYGGGGYGQRYWGISLTSNKFTATHFAGTAHGVNVHPVVLAKNAVVRELPDFTDAVDVEDVIVDLYTEGVDAVYIGKKGYGEQELLVINPYAICNMDATQYYECYQLFKDKVPMPSDEQLEDLLVSSKNYIRDYKTAPRKPSKPMSPQRPLRFFNDGNDPFARKPDSMYDQEMQKYNQDVSDYDNKLKDYEKRLEDFNNAEETKAWNQRREDLRNKMRI